MSARVILATTNGVAAAERDGAGWRATQRALAGQRVTSVAARGGTALAGTRDGIMRSEDGGRTWREANAGLTERYVRWLAFHPEIADLALAGTEPADIFLSRDGGQSWQECAGVAPLRDAHHWFLPYSSGAGCIRGFAFHGERGYAAAEVGGALRSDDGGKSWRLCAGSNGNPDLEGPPAPLIYPDVHSIEVHPSSPDVVFAPTGGGFYVSRDGGATWALIYECYVRAVWVDAQDPTHLVLGPADGVDRKGRIEETRDGGATWQPASGGLKTPWARHMVERFVQVDRELFAILSNGEVYVTPLMMQSPAPSGKNRSQSGGQLHHDWTWSRVFAELGEVNALSAMGE